MLTEKDYCDYGLLRSLIEIGYPKYRILDTGFRILLYEAQKWLREEKGIVVDVSFSPMEYFATIYINVRQTDSDKMYEFDKRVYAEGGDSYEEALLEGIKEAVKLLKEDK